MSDHEGDVQFPRNAEEVREEPPRDEPQANAQPVVQPAEQVGGGLEVNIALCMFVRFGFYHSI